MEGEVRTIYIATVTTFWDDYKLRGNDPSSMYGPKPFASLDDAKAWIMETYPLEDEYDWDDLRDHVNEKYVDIDEDDERTTLKEAYKNNWDAYTEIIAATTDGEYVPTTMDYSIKTFSVYFPPSPPSPSPPQAGKSGKNKKQKVSKK